MSVNASACSGLGDGNWPATIAAGKTVEVYQTGNTNVGPKAVYYVSGSYHGQIELNYTISGVDPAVGVNMSMSFSNGAPPFDFKIESNNSRTGDNPTGEKSGTAGEASSISFTHVGNDTSHGGALFQMG
ncbi:MAG: hypothetical protein QNJ09_16875 [Paracoccaceae bacterium]|nr:hypothetical protein [Paracoccaceae bacterium]